jgi:hypothetical protein
MEIKQSELMKRHECPYQPLSRSHQHLKYVSLTKQILTSKEYTIQEYPMVGI